MNYQFAILSICALISACWSLTCYECDSSAGDQTCLQNVVKKSWKSSVCSNKIDDLDLEIRPSAVRCVHISYTEGTFQRTLWMFTWFYNKFVSDNVNHLERKCGFEGLCELLNGLNDMHILGNVTNIDCHTCDTPRCNLVGNPRKVVFRNSNHLWIKFAK